MSLNDPRWGRGSQEPEKEEARGDDAGRSPETHDDQGAGRRDDAVRSRDADARSSKNRRRDGKQELSDEDIDRLWEDVVDTLSGVFGGGQKKRRGQANKLSELKSRDDFSRDDLEPSSQETSREASRDERLDDRRFAAPSPEDIPDDGGRGTGGSGRRRPPRMPKTGGRGLSLMIACAVLGWAVSGFYIVPEGQTGVVTTFGRYQKSTMPGFNWHIPAPIQDVDLVDVSSVRTAEIGMRGSSDRLREALMLTDDENIVDVQFNVQYRIKPETGARDYLFNTRAPDTSVTQAAESAMREVVGRKAMDSVLFESKAEIAEAVRVSMQSMLDRYSTGIEVMSVAIQNAQPPQQVQAAFNDAVKAGQDRERSINLGEAYMNAVIPKAQGTASRLKEEAEGYKARVVETARGDADRFASVYAEYSKAPEVTRDRIYVDAMKDIYSNVSKVYVDQKSGSSLLYLPLDKIIASTRAQAQTESEAAAASAASSPAQPSAASAASGTNAAGAVYATDKDPREALRSRLR